MQKTWRLDSQLLQYAVMLTTEKLQSLIASEGRAFIKDNTNSFFLFVVNTKKIINLFDNNFQQIRLLNLQLHKGTFIYLL